MKDLDIKLLGWKQRSKVVDNLYTKGNYNLIVRNNYISLIPIDPFKDEENPFQPNHMPVYTGPCNKIEDLKFITTLLKIE